MEVVCELIYFCLHLHLHYCCCYLKMSKTSYYFWTWWFIKSCFSALYPGQFLFREWLSKLLLWHWAFLFHTKGILQCGEVERRCSKQFMCHFHRYPLLPLASMLHHSMTQITFLHYGEPFMTKILLSVVTLLHIHGSFLLLDTGARRKKYIGICNKNESCYLCTTYTWLKLFKGKYVRSELNSVIYYSWK